MIESSTEEQKNLLSTFKNMFSKNKKISIALYGLGINTKYLLENLSGYNIVGLMDAENVGRSFFGYKVLSPEEAALKTKIIVIVARHAFQRIIYKRIEFLKKYNINICNLIGVDFEIKHSFDEKIQENPYWEKTESELQSMIDSHEVISFDIFDTLITRKILRPYNIFDIVERELKENNGIDIPFKEFRIQIEEKLKHIVFSPSFEQIYSELAIVLNLTEDIKNIIMGKEFEIEMRFLTPRKKMVDFFYYAIKHNKIVYLTSDMYLRKQYIEKLLKKAGIVGYIDIIISNENKKTKENGDLFCYLKEKVNQKSILHVGDNYHADFVNAQKFGLSAYHIMSSYDLLLNSSMADLLTHVSSVQDSIILGVFIAKALNDPFVLNKTKGFLPIKSPEEIGYYCYAPLTMVFMLWFLKEINKSKNAVVLFAARDGYLPEKLYKFMIEKMNLNELNESEYFLISRRAVTVATIENKEDIERIINHTAMNCKIGDVLRTKFGVEPSSYDTLKDEMISTTIERFKLMDYIFSYEEKILERAKIERANYYLYIKEKFSLKGRKFILFDLVSSGTIPFYVEKLLKQPVNSICFATTNLPNDYFSDTSYIKSMFGNHTSSQNDIRFLKYYLLWESVFTSPQPQLIHFDDNGNPIFAESSLSQKKFSQIKKVHDGIFEYIEDFLYLDLNLIQHNCSSSFTDLIWQTIMPSSSILTQDIKNIFIFENLYDGIQENYSWNNLV